MRKARTSAPSPAWSARMRMAARSSASMRPSAAAAPPAWSAPAAERRRGPRRPQAPGSGVVAVAATGSEWRWQRGCPRPAGAVAKRQASLVLVGRDGHIRAVLMPRAARVPPSPIWQTRGIAAHGPPEAAGKHLADRASASNMAISVQCVHAAAEGRAGAGIIRGLCVRRGRGLPPSGPSGDGT